MNHNHTTSGNYQQTPQSQEQYREELALKAVSESVGNVAFHTTIDLNYEERQAIQQSLAERSAIAGNIPTDGATRRGGGFGEYADISYTAQYMHVAEPFKTIDPDAIKMSSSEGVCFGKEEDGRVSIAYSGSTFTDNSGRPGGGALIGFNVTVETAAALKEATKADPSVIDQVVNAQLEAVGISQQRRDNYFHFKMGTLKNFQIDPNRTKNIYEFVDGQPIKQAVRYDQKRPIDIPQTTPEQFISAEQHIAEPEVYDVEANAKANELRREMIQLRGGGAPHFNRALYLKTEAAEKIGQEAADKVYAEVGVESVDDIDVEMQHRITAYSKLEKDNPGLTPDEVDTLYVSHCKEEFIATLHDFMRNKPLSPDELLTFLDDELSNLGEFYNYPGGLPENKLNIVTLLSVSYWDIQDMIKNGSFFEKAEDTPQAVDIDSFNFVK